MIKLKGHIGYMCSAMDIYLFIFLGAMSYSIGNRSQGAYGFRFEDKCIAKKNMYLELADVEMSIDFDAEKKIENTDCLSQKLENDTVRLRLFSLEYTFYIFSSI